jgi:LAGLIDADG endonuclease
MTNYKEKEAKFSYSLALEISQRTKDLYILKAISYYFGTGNIYSDNKGLSKVKFNNIKNIQHRLLPFFYCFPLLGFKLTQYNV